MTIEDSKKNEGITLKGNAGGLLVRFNDDELYNYEDLLTSLEHRLSKSEKFFQRAQTSIDLGKRVVSFEELEQLQGLLARFEMKLSSIVSGSNSTRSAAKQAGIEFKLPTIQNTRPHAVRENDPAGMPFDSAEALFVRRTLRSGQVIKHHADVCLIGDVNPGAEIIAGGSVLVWGVVKGVIQAGSMDNSRSETACVCALQLIPSLLRIGDLVARAPENQPVYSGPEMALISEGAIVVEPWFVSKKR